jgi:hypothetical protein
MYRDTCGVRFDEDRRNYPAASLVSRGVGKARHVTAWRFAKYASQGT